MVVLNRIYTRTGDDGTTSLGSGARRKKYDFDVHRFRDQIIGADALGDADCDQRFAVRFGPVRQCAVHARYGEMRFSLLRRGGLRLESESIFVDCPFERAPFFEPEPTVQVVASRAGDRASLGRMRHRTRIASGLFRGDDEQ